MEILVGVVLLVGAVVVVRLGRPESDGWLGAGIKRWKAQGALSVLATACVGLGLALVVNGGVSFIP